MKKKALFALAVFFAGAACLAQKSTNIDPKAAPININLPRTPESAGFEKYGSTSVNELTGTPNISIPLYNLQGRFLQLPMSVTYDASGIRVGQEASLIGLGFNLNVGGRITVETRGCVDNHPVTAALFNAQTLAAGMQKLFSRLGNSNGNGILTFASTCYQCDTTQTGNIPDDWASVNAMAQFGLGEPDIFHANFLGYSFSYFYDKITGGLRFIGEKNLFSITNSMDASGRIQSWEITDNQGIKYNFNQKETTSTYLPPQATLYGNSSTSAWLLTRILHPTGDSINFTYTNFGNTYPAFARNASLSFDNPSATINPSSDAVQDTIIQNPAYLTRIESQTAVIDFVLSNRDDIKGTGAKKLDVVRISDKLTGLAKKKISFGFAYFNSTFSSCYTSVPDSVSKYYKLRLKLNTLTIDDTASLGSPYQFYYYNESGMPDKYSYGQDHWGYLNSGASTFDPCSPKALLPVVGTGNDLGYSTVASIGKNRECTPSLLSTLSMDSIVYPTGGSTKFIYEPHESEKANPFMQPAGTVNGVSMISLSYTTSTIVGGGQRVKVIRNYASGRLATTVEYSYSSGLYMGAIRYNTSKSNLYSGSGSSPFRDVLSVNGSFNDNDFLVGYRNVTITQRDSKGQRQGYISKGYKITPIYYVGNNGLGFEVQAAHWPTGTYCLGGSCQTHTNSLLPLVPPYTTNAPTPKKGLDGKLVSENYYDNANQLVKSVEYFYSLKGYSEDFYSARVTDNLVGSDNTVNFTTAGNRRYTVFVSPAKSYFSLTDSVVEKTYSGLVYLKQKKSYRYNDYGQLVNESMVNSDGTETISLTRTSLEVDPPHYPISGSGDALLINNLKGAHIYDLPIEQVQLKRMLTGDTVVLQGALSVYNGILPLKVFRLENARPLTYRTEFIPYYFTYPNAPNYPSGGNFTLVKDAKYKFFSEADYSSASQLRALRNVAGNSAFIWDEYYNTVLASCTEADSSSIAFTSFETQATGRWSFSSSGIVTDNTAPTGSKCYSLSAGDITLSGLNSSKTYVVSFWKKAGSQSVSGKTGTAGITLNGWTYTEVSINNTTTATITGSGAIDELRLYPLGSQMTTYTYSPLIGISASVTPSNRISYFEYDDIGRLSRIRDQNKNLLKVVAYKFRDIVSYPYGNTEQTQSFSTTCSTGYVSTVINYTVPANKYGSVVSVADANSYAQAEITAVGPDLQAQCTCIPSYSFTTCCGWSAANSSFSLSGTGSVNFTLVLATNNSSVYGQIGTLTGALFLPSADRYVTVTYQGQNYTLLFRTTGVVEIFGNPFTNTIQLSGSFAL